MTGEDLRHKTWLQLDSSKIKEYMRCPRKFMYRYIFGWELEQPNIHLVFGEAWHRAMEVLLQDGYTSEALLKGWNRLDEYYNKHIPNPDLYHPKTPEVALQLLVHYVDRWQHDNFKVLYTETGGAVAIDKDTMIHCRLDSICEDADGGIFSLEHKTASMLARWWEEQWYMDFSLGTYTHFLHCFYPDKQINGIQVNATLIRKGDIGKKYKSLDDAPFRRVLVRKDTGMMERWLELARWWTKAMHRDILKLTETKDTDHMLNTFSQNPESCISYGRVCKYHDFCLAWNNPLQFASDPPPGYKIEWWDPHAKAKEATNYLG